MSANVRVRIPLKKIYACCCDKCKLRIKKLVSMEIKDEMVTQILGDDLKEVNEENDRTE